VGRRPSLGTIRGGRGAHRSGRQRPRARRAAEGPRRQARFGLRRMRSVALEGCARPPRRWRSIFRPIPTPELASPRRRPGAIGDSLQTSNPPKLRSKASALHLRDAYGIEKDDDVLNNIAVALARMREPAEKSACIALSKSEDGVVATGRAKRLKF